MKAEGGCLCGAIRYRVSEEPVAPFICHCRDCPKTSGSGNVPLMMVPQTGFAVEGETAVFKGKGDSEREVDRHFCRVCGSSVFATAEVVPGRILIAAGTLDNTDNFRPSKSNYTVSRTHWDVPYSASDRAGA